MMKKGKSRIACLIMACLLLCCGCGGNGTEIFIGEAESAETVDSAQEKTAESSESTEQSSAVRQDTTIRVYVCGAVANPGVVEIPQGSRAEDALKAAGGFAAEAGREAVNLADWVSDGQKLYFPTVEETLEESQAQADTAAGLININTADAAALCTLPGIGESRAQDIISYREANGGFESCEDIMKVSGIKTAAYEKIRDKITVK